MDDSPLARLPGEIRTIFYEHALISDYPIKLSCKRSSQSQKHQQKKHLKPIALLLALTQTCCQIRHESKGIFFEFNTFAFRGHWPSSLYGPYSHAISFLPVAYWNAIRRVQFELLPGICFCRRCDYWIEYELRSKLRSLVAAIAELARQNLQCKYAFDFAPCYAKGSVQLVFGDRGESWERAVEMAGDERLWRDIDDVEEQDFQRQVQARALKILLDLLDVVRRAGCG